MRENLGKTPSVGPEQTDIFRDIHLKRQGAAVERVAGALCGVMQQFGNIDRLDLKLQGAGVDGGQIEDGIDNGQKIAR